MKQDPKPLSYGNMIFKRQDARVLKNFAVMFNY